MTQRTLESDYFCFICYERQIVTVHLMNVTLLWYSKVHQKSTYSWCIYKEVSNFDLFKILKIFIIKVYLLKGGM